MEDVQAIITQLWKTSERKVIASLVRIVRDVGLAEELAHDALVAALEEWPARGVPPKPEAWLLFTAKNRALNTLRHQKVVARSEGELSSELDARSGNVEAAVVRGIDEDIADDVLRLVFIACHPVLSKEARVALTLRLLGGLSSEEIARAFLTSEPTIQQRIVRAKRTLAEAKVPFELPKGVELGPRLGSVLEVVYLVFNEGYWATAGEDVMRPGLVAEAMRLGALLCDLAPNEPETHGLVALMELTQSRAAARTDAAGDPVLLSQQDRTTWDQAAIARGLAALSTAESLTTVRGPYVLQAAIAACHARAATAAETSWRTILSLYDELAERHPSPIVELNRAIAVAEVDGPAAGLAVLDRLSLPRYHLLPAARAELLERLGLRAEARAEFTRAASLTDNARRVARLLARAARLAN